MGSFLGKIRVPDRKNSIGQQAAISTGIAILGFLFGVMQKWIDGMPSNALPLLFQRVDIRNYFGRLAIWILLATIISVYAYTPIRASINTFLFLISMVAGYYLYCNFVLGFLNLTYMLVWIVIAAISPVLAFVCWYAKGNGIIAIAISAIIIGVLFSQAILITQRVYVTHILEVITWIIGVLILKRKLKEFAFEIGLSFVVAIVYQLTVMHYIGM